MGKNWTNLPSSVTVPFSPPLSITLSMSLFPSSSLPSSCFPSSLSLFVFFLLQLRNSTNSAKLSAHHNARSVPLPLPLSSFLCHTLALISGCPRNSFAAQSACLPNLFVLPQTVAQTSTMQFQSILWHIYLPST